MGNWTGVVTNAGNDLLNKWVSGKTLHLTAAEAGGGTVPEAALLAQTSVSGTLEGSGVRLTGYSRIPNGVQLRIQIAAPEESYTLRQIGVWAKLDGEAAELLALFQSREGVPIQGRSDYPDFSYTFYGAIALDNTGKFEVHVDTSAIVSLETLRNEIDRLKLELFTNTLTLPLTADSGEALLTSSGTPLLAVYHPDRSAAVLAELAALAGRLSGHIAETAKSLSADCATASMRDQAYADGQVLTLERAVDKKIQTEKAEAITATVTVACENAAAQIAAHNSDTGAHPAFLRLAENTIPPDPEPPVPIP